MWQKIKSEIEVAFIKLITRLPLIIIVWSIGFYTLRQSVKQFTLEHPEKIHPLHLAFLSLSLVLILFPFVKSLKIGSVFQVEQKLEETKQEVRDFKNEVRQMFTVLSNNLTNSQTVNNFFGNEAKLQKAKSDLFADGVEQDVNFKSKVQQTKDELILENEDLMVALARTRMRIESLLRKIVGKSINLNPTKRDVKFLGLTSLYQLFTEQYSGYDHTKKAFTYVVNISNAAIHGQIISDGVASEALELGAGLIEIFEKILRENK